jgi:hypothetical protein
MLIGCAPEKAGAVPAAFARRRQGIYKELMQNYVQLQSNYGSLSRVFGLPAIVPAGAKSQRRPRLMPACCVRAGRLW